MAFTSTPFHLCGWVDDPRRHATAAIFPTFAQIAPNLMNGRKFGDILLYKAWSEVLGHEPPYLAQTIGDCVSHGFSHANDLLQCVQECLKGNELDYQETLTEFIYGESRKLGNMLGSQDGSIGVYAVKAAKEVGMLSRDMIDSGTYDGRRAKNWGYSGPPSELETKASSFKLGAAALVKTWDELVAALGNGYPVTVASDQGFTMTRDSQGICQAQGSWAHQMHFCGIIGDTAVCGQSWGPGTPSGPVVLDMPSFTFRVQHATAQRMLSQGDSWALSQSPAFHKRVLPSSWTYEDFLG